MVVVGVRRIVDEAPLEGPEVEAVDVPITEVRVALLPRRAAGMVRVCGVCKRMRSTWQGVDRVSTVITRSADTPIFTDGCGVTNTNSK